MVFACNLVKGVCVRNYNLRYILIREMGRKIFICSSDLHAFNGLGCLYLYNNIIEIPICSVAGTQIFEAEQILTQFFYVLLSVCGSV